MENKTFIQIEKVDNGFIVHVNVYEHNTTAKVFSDQNDVIAYVTNVIQTGQR